MRHRAGDDALPDTAFAQEVVFGRFCATIPFALHVLRDVVPLPEFRHLFLREFAGEQFADERFYICHFVFFAVSVINTRHDTRYP